MTQKLTLPGPAKGGWTVDVPAIRLAIEFLGITNPVEIKLSSGYNRVGCARFRNGVHVITVTSLHDAAGASGTIWHELTHAAQREYLGDGFGPAYRMESAMHGYRNNRFEVEARQMTDDMADTPLTKR